MTLTPHNFRLICPKHCITVLRLPTVVALLLLAKTVPNAIIITLVQTQIVPITSSVQAITVRGVPLSVSLSFPDRYVFSLIFNASLSGSG
jgi:hypothetical protein